MGEGCGPSPVLPGTFFRCSFQLHLYYLPTDPSWVLGRWQSCGSMRPLRGRPIDLSEVAGDVRPVLPAGGSPLVGLVNSVGPVGPCGMLSPYAEKIHEPLQHSVLILADQAGRPSAVPI